MNRLFFFVVISALLAPFLNANTVRLSISHSSEAFEAIRDVSGISAYPVFLNTQQLPNTDEKTLENNNFEIRNFRILTNHDTQYVAPNGNPLYNPNLALQGWLNGTDNSPELKFVWEVHANYVGGKSYFYTVEQVVRLSGLNLTPPFPVIELTSVPIEYVGSNGYDYYPQLTDSVQNNGGSFSVVCKRDESDSPNYNYLRILNYNLEVDVKYMSLKDKSGQRSMEQFYFQIRPRFVFGSQINFMGLDQSSPAWARMQKVRDNNLNEEAFLMLKGHEEGWSNNGL